MPRVAARRSLRGIETGSVCAVKPSNADDEYVSESYPCFYCGDELVDEEFGACPVCQEQLERLARYDDIGFDEENWYDSADWDGDDEDDEYDDDDD